MTLQLTLDMSQRWSFGKPKYRPSGETIRPADYEVAEIPRFQKEVPKWGFGFCWLR